jgi:hypothetical protein
MTNKFEIGPESKITPEPGPKRSNQKPKSTEKQKNIQEQATLDKFYEKTPEELEEIEEIHHQLVNVEPTSLPQQEKLISQNPIEIEIINGEKYYVEYVPKDAIYPRFGYNEGNKAVVRQDLPPRVKKFVKAHELYHCRDKSNFGGQIGKEIRANIIPGIKDPIGLAVSVWKTITNIDRIKLYLDRIRRGY